MADQIIEEKILFRFSKLIKDSQVPSVNIRPDTLEAAFFLQSSVAEQLVNDPDVTVSLSIIPKSNLLNVNNI